MDKLVVVGHLKVLDENLCERLQEDGLDVFETEDQDEAVRLCIREKPALAFVEVDAPAQDNYDLLPRLREALDEHGRIVAVCNRYSERLDDYCEEMGANFALPQVDDQANFTLFVRGLISLMPEKTGSSQPVH